MSILDERTYFSLNELRLPKSEWDELVQQKRLHLTPGVRSWLRIWILWESAVQPMDDSELSAMRLGHYMGWASHEYETE